MRQGDHHVFFGDQVFQGQIEMIDQDFGAPLVAVLLAHLHQLVANHLHEPVGIVKYVQQIVDSIDHFLVLIDNLVLLQTGEPMQAQIENGLCLDFRQTVDIAVVAKACVQSVRSRRFTAGALQHVSDDTRQPFPAHQFVARLGTALATP